MICRSRDARLSAFAETKGWTVIRLWEREINNELERVVADIEQVRLSMEEY